MRTKSHFSFEECCHLDLHIVDYCQLRCKHCYLNKGSTSMPLEMVKDLCLDFMNSSLPTKFRRIILNGGDAPLHPKFQEICSFVRNISGQISFSSNGILINEIVHLLQKTDTVQISLDGDQHTHDFIRGKGSYYSAVYALHQLQDEGIPHSISCTVNRQNVHCIEQVIDIARSTGSKLLNLSYYTPIIPSDLSPFPYPDWLNLKQQVRTYLAKEGIIVPVGCTETGCIGGILGVSVLPDGTYWDCSRNQRVIGRFPQKIAEVLDTGNIHERRCADPALTCLRRRNHE